MNTRRFSRRDLVRAGLALGVTPAWSASLGRIRSKPIPSSGEELPVIGLGTYQSFDVSGWPWQISARRELVDLMIEHGATVVDSSPQYVPSEEILGDVIDDGQIVRNENIGQAEFGLEILQEVQNLRLDGNVQGGNRFIANQHIGRQG